MFGYTISGGDGMLRDRGTIKWTSLMLPEHVQILKEMWEEDKRMHPPELDEQAMQELNEKCVNAHHTQETVLLTQFEDGSFSCYEGKIKKLLPNEGSIQFQTSNSSVKRIPFSNIVHIE